MDFERIEVIFFTAVLGPIPLCEVAGDIRKQQTTCLSACGSSPKGPRPGDTFNLGNYELKENVVVN